MSDFIFITKAPDKWAFSGLDEKAAFFRFEWAQNTHWGDKLLIAECVTQLSLLFSF